MSNRKEFKTPVVKAGVLAHGLHAFFFYLRRVSEIETKALMNDEKNK